MHLDAVLARLERVRQRMPGQWSACCPCSVHKRKLPRLSIKMADSGAVLLHCFSGCSIEDVLAAMGLDMQALFPPRPAPGQGQPPGRRRLMTAGQALEVIQFECLLVSTAALNLANGHALSADDLQRLRTAAQRIQALSSEALG